MRRTFSCVHAALPGNGRSSVPDKIPFGPDPNIIYRTVCYLVKSEKSQRVEETDKMLQGLSVNDFCKERRLHGRKSS